MSRSSLTVTTDKRSSPCDSRGKLFCRRNESIRISARPAQGDKPGMIEFDREVTETVSEILMETGSTIRGTLRFSPGQVNDVLREEPGERRPDRDVARAPFHEEAQMIDDVVANIQAFHDEQSDHLNGLNREFTDDISLVPSRPHLASGRVCLGQVPSACRCPRCRNPCEGSP